MSPTSTGAMTPQEAGRLGGQKGGSRGGKAPHSCRGFECQQQSSNSKSKNNK